MELRLVWFIAALFSLVLATAPELRAAQDTDSSRYEIKKFRFRRHKNKDFERLVIEFSPKGTAKASPTVHVDTGSSGKESIVTVDHVNLVGAIPEALINDSYVPKSSFLGPISLNTDGPTTGFNLRTFLKEPVAVDAFWLEHPSRLVLDVFPANSSRMEGRVPDPEPSRGLASTPSRTHDSRHEAKSEGGIVCYPISSAVSAEVNFQPKMSTSFSPVEVLPMTKSSAGTEPVICFLASSQVVASVSFRAKSKDNTNYVQWDGPFGHKNEESERNISSLPAPPPPPPPPPMPMAPAAPTAPAAPAGPANGFKGGAIVVPNITPGRTPLGSTLANPASITRLPTSAMPAKISGEASFGTQIGPGSNPLAGAMAPPLK